MFDALLEGWRRAQGGRHLSDGTKRSREATVRRFQEHVSRWPWEWQPVDVDEWIEDLGAPTTAAGGLDASRLSGRAARVHGLPDR